MKDLIALADRVERASGPDRNLDADIAQYAYGWKVARVGLDCDGENASEILTCDGLLPKGFSYPNRGKIHRAYHCEQYTRDCLDPAFAKDVVRKQLAESLRALSTREIQS
jgi:hypothetical protein